MTSFFQKLFGNNSENNKRKSNAPQARRLRIESLESRELLAVSPAEFDSIRAMYPDLNLSANMSSYNVIEITAAQLSDTALRNAISEAGETIQSDLIVCRTTETQNRITLGGTELRISISSTRGSVTIVSFGDKPLTIDANQKSRVFYFGATTAGLGGLTITNGVVSGSNGNGNGSGGGIDMIGTDLIVTHCTISNNRASDGGGISNSAPNARTLTVTNSTISGNKATASSGGGISTGGSSKATIVKNCTISGNSASNSGGGLTGSMTVIDCTISGNTCTSGAGGGIHSLGMTATGCTISGNTSTNGKGGGISGAVTITNCTISGNTAIDGGGLYAGSSSSALTVTNSIISGNTATNNGGGISSIALLVIVNCLIVGNKAGANGAGIYANAGTGSTNRITNCTIVGNSGGGSGFYNNSGTTTLNNTIVAHNSIDIICFAGTVTGSNNLVGKGGPLANGTNNNIIGTTTNPVDPKFVSYTSYTTWTSNRWKDWDLRLATDSPAIDKGNNTLIPSGITTDILGNPRIFNGTVDIGAYEYQGVTIDLPAVPENLYCRARTTIAIEIGWDAVEDATSYETQYRKFGDTAWNSVTTTGTRCLRGGFVADTTYEFQVRAINADGHSDWSASLFVKTALPTPTNLQYTDTTSDSIALAWDNVTIASGYEVRYQIPYQIPTEVWTNIPVSETSTTVISLVANTCYEFQVRAISADNNSAWSASVFIATNAGTPTDDPTHKIFTTTSVYTVEPGKSFTLDIKHELLNKEEGRLGTGLGLRIEYDPTWLTYTGYQSYLTTGALNAPREDTKGVIIVAWNDQSSNWPGTDAAVDLLKANFAVKEGAPPDTSTLIQISVNYPTEGFNIETPQPITVNFAKTVTLDISGTGTVTPADANLLLRYLYGYSGVGLTQYLVTSGAERDTAGEIIAYLEANRKIFDIDGDGNVTPVDANLLLRYLYGYTGEGLTQYLVTGNSTRKTATEIVSYIESVLPTKTKAASVMAAASFGPVSMMDILPASASDVPTQQITASTNVTTAEPGTPLNLKVFHEILDREAGRLAWGISLIVHYDPDYVEYQATGATYFFPGFLGVMQHDPTRNTITIGWNDYSFNWPGTDALVELLSLNFNVKANAPAGEAVFEIEVNWPTPDYNLIPEDGVIVVAVTVEETPVISQTVVTTLEDTLDPPDGLISLRYAIANALPGDTITFAPSLAGETITLAGSELIIDKSITIDSEGKTIVIDAGGNSRVMSIASGTMVTLFGLTITGGKTTGDGGGIINAGRLAMFDCTIIENSARRGGGISSSGTTTLFNTVISGNQSSSYGGGVYIQRGTTIMENCTVSGNEMVPFQLPSGAMSGGLGGGIYNGGTLFLTGGEISNNTALLFGGGGLYNEGRATIDNCIISENEAEWGGGVTNSNNGTMTITNGTIEKNKANQGYGGIGNAGDLTLYDTIVTENTAKRLGGGLGNNTGTVRLSGGTLIEGNDSKDTYPDIWTNREIAETWFNTIVAPASFGAVPVAPVYEISTPTDSELFAKTLTYWEFSAAAISSSPIKDWEINWGDGSENTLVLGGPRSRINVTHYFREAGTYTVTIKTTDFDGVVNTITIGNYTVKERVVEPLVVESFAWVEPELAFEFDTPGFSLEEPVTSAAPMQFTSESRFADDYLSGLMEIMRQRQMLDLDQSGQKSEGVPFSELVWSDDDLFDTDWTALSEQQEEGDFWSELFENDLLALK